MKLCARSFGLAGGILWGLALLVTTWISIPTHYAAGFLDIIQGIYPGYRVSFIGSFLGLAYGFVDGFAGLFILAWLYNRIQK